MLCLSTGSWLTTVARLKLSPSPLQFYPVSFLHRSRCLTPINTDNPRAASSHTLPTEDTGQEWSSAPTETARSQAAAPQPGPLTAPRPDAHAPTDDTPVRTRALAARADPYPHAVNKHRAAPLPSLCACAIRRGGGVFLSPRRWHT